MPGDEGSNLRRRLGQIKTAYASGVGLRELARNMNVPEGTVLAHAKRKGWTQQIATARLIERPELMRELAKSDAISAITPMQSVAACMKIRGEKHLDQMANISARTVTYVGALQPAEVLDKIDQVEKLDRVAARRRAPAYPKSVQMLSDSFRWYPRRKGASSQ